jgi:hypothetical protein
VTERGAKKSRSDLDNLMGKNADYYILEEIKFKLKHYELTIKEMKTIVQKISILLNILKKN